MKTYQIPDGLLAAAVTLLERLPAQKDVRSVLNALEHCVTEQNKPPVQDGGGGPGPED